MFKKMLFAGALIMLAVGCASAKQAVQDYNTGKELVESGQVADPRVEAKEIVSQWTPFLPEPLKPIAAVFVSVLGAIGLRNRGKENRLNIPAGTMPILGSFGKKTRLEDALQLFAEVTQGATELVGSDGSITRRTWKMALLSAIPVFLLQVPAIGEWAAANSANLLLLISGGTAVLGGLDKALQKTVTAQLPPAPPTPQPTI
jgi:hypothetical protein